MAHFFMPDDLLTRRKVFAISLGIAGVFFIALTKGQMIGEGWSFYGGIILLIVSILIGGGTNIIVAKYLGDLHPVGLTALANLSGGVLLYLFALIVEPAVDNGMPSDFFIALFWFSFYFCLWLFCLVHYSSETWSEGGRDQRVEICNTSYWLCLELGDITR